MQQALTGLTRSHNRGIKWIRIIEDYSRQEFGTTPGEVDCDKFIDSCDGGCGASDGMSVDEFMEAMRECVT